MNIEETIKKNILSTLLAMGTEAKEQIKARLDSSFKEYLHTTYSKYSKTKSILYRDQPVNIKDFYIRTNLVSAKKIIKETEFLSFLSSKRKLSIQGTAGSGKSTFSKSIFLEIVESGEYGIPVLVELRHLNNFEGKTNLIDYTRSTLKINDAALSEAEIDISLKSGKIILILDGFDEITHPLKDIYENEILQICNKYKNLKIVVTSRPDERFDSWEEFNVARILPLTKKQACELISKLDYDQDTKSKFQKELEASLYEKHKSFSSVPLLLTLMLMTYEQMAEIPEKVHLFYEQAFVTLFNKHDSYKSLFKRKTHTSLAIDDFKKVLSSFCISTYLSNKFYFSDTTDIEQDLYSSIKISKIDCCHSAYLKDLIESVCIIQRDGTGYTFSHRSFQEYFTAYFVTQHASQEKYKLIDALAKAHVNDEAIPMLFDMSNETFEQEWLLPKLKRILPKYKKLDYSKESDIKRLSYVYSSIIPLEKEGSFACTLSSDTYVVFLIKKIYKEKNELDFSFKKSNQTLIKERRHASASISLKSPSGEDLIELINSNVPELGRLTMEKFESKILDIQKKKSDSQKDMSAILSKAVTDRY